MTELRAKRGCAPQISWSSQLLSQPLWTQWRISVQFRKWVNIYACENNFCSIDPTGSTRVTHLVVAENMRPFVGRGMRGMMIGTLVASIDYCIWLLASWLVNCLGDVDLLELSKVSKAHARQFFSLTTFVNKIQALSYCFSNMPVYLSTTMHPIVMILV